MTTPMTRVQRAMAHQEPDRVPLFLLTTLHGAKALGLSIREYFSRAENIVEGQMRLQAKFRSDCVTPSLYAALEAEAFGAETAFFDDGPPNCSGPVIHQSDDIDHLPLPRLGDTPGLLRGLETIRQLKERVGDSIPIVGSVTSPFSLPIMQMGFGRYIELLYNDPPRFERLMAVNQAFCIEWANAQLKAGATAIGYADPMSSTTIIPRDLYLKTGFRIAQETLSRIEGSTAIHLASGRGLPIAEDIVATRAVAIGISTLEDLADWKIAVGDRMTLIGNLNGIAMRQWSFEDVEREVKQAIAAAGRGGGFILSDNHGEIPWQVPDTVLLAIREAADHWGQYPLDWIGET
ncbi:MAG TPA: uroporphyrinogen decarboxylase family protein [Rhodocyclaceae bacterium]|nr:uroporphyrinogen decarboxylase family protein [Rhodocyclaceae bacterium]